MQVRAYVRVSTDEQAHEGFSIPTQRQRIADYCRAVFDDRPLIAWYADEGFSAKNMARPALQRLRAEACTGEIVLVLRLDRLTRSVGDLYVLLNEWGRTGVAFRSVTESFNTDTPEGRFMVTLLASLAQWERERTAGRVREVMSNILRQDRRHVSRAPFGYALRAGRLEVVEREAAVVRSVFRKYLGGSGTRAIALELNRQGLKTRQGAVWTDFTISYILRNPVYAGQVAWGRIRSHGKQKRAAAAQSDAIIVAGTHRPLIDPETWAAARETAARRKRLAPRAVGGPHPLTGLAVCGLCGGPLHGFVQRRYKEGQWLPGRDRRYYRCSHRDHAKRCGLPYLSADRLEAAVVAGLTPLAGPGVLRDLAGALGADDTTTAAAEASALKAELAQLEQRQRRWDEAYESGDLARPEWSERIAPLCTRRAAITADLARLSAACRPPGAGAVAAALADLGAVWAALSPRERKTVLQGLLNRITVAPDGRPTLLVRTFGPGPRSV